MLHASEGMALLWDTYVADTARVWKRTYATASRVSAAIGIVITLSGVYALWREDIVPVPFLLSRIRTVYLTSGFYTV